MDKLIAAMLEDMKNKNPEVALASKFVETARGNSPGTIITSLTLVMGFVISHFAKDFNARIELHKIINETLKEDIEGTKGYTKEKASAILASIRNATATKQ